MAKACGKVRQILAFEKTLYLESRLWILIARDGKHKIKIFVVCFLQSFLFKTETFQYKHTVCIHTCVYSTVYNCTMHCVLLASAKILDQSEFSTFVYKQNALQ